MFEVVKQHPAFSTMLEVGRRDVNEAARTGAARYHSPLIVDADEGRHTLRHLPRLNKEVRKDDATG